MSETWEREETDAGLNGSIVVDEPTDVVARHFVPVPAPRRISVFGLGYVGAVSAACLARMGHKVVGLDPNAGKRQRFAQGCPPVVEPRLEVLMREAQRFGTLGAGADAAAAIRDTDVSLVCVGTPSRANGSVDTDLVAAVAGEIGRALRGKAGRHLVIVRSTVVPGTMRNTVIPILERESGRRCGADLRVAYNPEFLREGSAIADFFAPPKIVIGAGDAAAAAEAAALTATVAAPRFDVAFEVAEMIKYADNSWHALKVCFGNEIGNVCQALGIDSHALMEVFCADTKLNIAPTYLRPGFAFGGSCLPKDTRALTQLARQLDVEAPILHSILPSNRAQVERALRKVLSYECRTIAVLGCSFKAGTDDLRESPQIELIERLIGKGYAVRLYDSNVRLAALTGANRQAVETAVPHIASLMADTLPAAVEGAGLVIVGNAAPEFRTIRRLLKPEQHVLDLVRVCEAPQPGERYAGLNW